MPALLTSTTLTPVLSILHPTVLPSDNLNICGFTSSVFNACVTAKVVLPPPKDLTTEASALSKSTANPNEFIVSSLPLSVIDTLVPASSVLKFNIVPTLFLYMPVPTPKFAPSVISPTDVEFIVISVAVDDRGKVTFVNGFDFKGVLLVDV